MKHFKFHLCIPSIEVDIFFPLGAMIFQANGVQFEEIATKIGVKVKNEPFEVE